jgi:hypothetical protein
MQFHGKAVFSPIELQNFHIVLPAGEAQVLKILAFDAGQIK